MPAKRDIDFNNKKAYGLKSVTLKDQDATPVGDLLLKDVDQVLRVRDSGDQADKSVAVSSVPDLPASKITSGAFDLTRIPTPLTGKDADSVDGVHLPATIASVLSDHTKAVHDALAINADLLDSLHAADFALSGHTHSQYFLSADHTKVVHDALAINADQVDGHDLDQDVKITSQPTFGQLYVSRADATGYGVKVEIRDTVIGDLGYLSFAVIALRSGLGNEGGMFFGSQSAYFIDSYGIVNGITFGPGTDAQDIGFRVGAAIGGLGGPTVIIKADGKVGIKKISPAYTLDVGGDIHLTGDHVVPVKDAIPSDTPPVGTMRFVRLAANQNRIYVYTADGWQWHHFGGSGLQWWSDGIPYP